MIMAAWCSDGGVGGGNCGGSSRGRRQGQLIDSMEGCSRDVNPALFGTKKSNLLVSVYLVVASVYLEVFQKESDKYLFIWRQMWGETRGRWEGSPVGKFLEQVSKFEFFHGFPATYRFWNSRFFRDFPQFLGDPKKSQNADFFRSVSGFWRLGSPKNSSRKIWIFPRCPAIFRGPKKFLKRGFPRGFLGFWRTDLSKFFRNSDFPAVFLGILKGWTHPKSEPANLSAVFLGF